jgi:hypothetical protein
MYIAVWFVDEIWTWGEGRWVSWDVVRTHCFIINGDNRCFFVKAA